MASNRTIQKEVGGPLNARITLGVTRGATGPRIGQGDRTPEACPNVPPAPPQTPMPALVTATLHGRGVRFDADPSGDSERWAWFDAETGEPDTTLALAWMGRDRLRYHPDPFGEEVEFMRGLGATDIVVPSEAFGDNGPDTGGPDSVY